MKIIKHIKIRIGEPLTAIAINATTVIFGSITGYIGVYSKANNEVYYHSEVFDELIRSITINDAGIACVAVGDLHGVILDCSEPEKIESEIIKYEQKQHSPTQCASTIPFLYKHFCLLVAFPSTNIKELMIDGGNTRMNAWLIDYKEKHEENLCSMQFGEHAVPYCFNGKKWLDYSNIKSKNLMCFDIATKQTVKICEFSNPKSVEYISHVRLYKNKLIFVYNHKKVQIMDLETKEVQVLYEHNSQIVLLEIFDKKLDEINRKAEERDEHTIEESKGPDDKKKKTEIDNNSIDDLMIVTADHSETLCSFTNREPMRRVAIRKLPGFPQLNKGTYLFDMGFPYYMAIDNKFVAFTSDIGLFVLQYN